MLDLAEPRQPKKIATHRLGRRLLDNFFKPEKLKQGVDCKRTRTRARSLER
jgi:hypothetical protein